MSQRIIDLSHPLNEDTPPFPGDVAVKITIADSTASTTPAPHRHLNCSQIRLSLHCGTHMDAPFHFFGDGQTIDKVALERCIGPAVLINVGLSRLIEVQHLAGFEAAIRAARRVILNTGWHQRWRAPEYFSEHPIITGSAAQFLVDCGVVLVGVDTPSVDRPPFDAHLAFLGNGVIIVENLTNLDAIGSDSFQLVAIPLKISGRDGSPVRAVACV